MEISWFVEKHTPHAGLTLAVGERLFDQVSPYQRVEVVQTLEYGRMLLLDGKVMLTERDEFIYHEMIVHPAMLSHPEPSRIAIVGGGDGGTVREVLRHSAVRQVDLVEIDRLVVDVGRRYFPSLSQGLDDPRVRVNIADGFKFLASHPESYDVILVDSIDPVGEAAKLFTAPFFSHARKALHRGGMLVCQSESPFYNSELIRGICDSQRALFAHVALYLAHIPTYPSGQWSFTFASDTVDPLKVSPGQWAGVPSGLRYFNPEVFRAAFALPNYLKETLAA